MAASDELVALGRVVRALRLARDMSIDDLAAAAGVAPGELAGLERGEHDPILDDLRDLADALRIRTSTLMLEAERPSQDEHVLFGQRLRELRTERPISQERLARGTGVHRTVIGKLEQGTSDPRLSTILRLARGLDIPPETLVKGLTATRREA